jgi:hypothetical protein
MSELSHKISFQHGVNHKVQSNRNHRSHIPLKKRKINPLDSSRLMVTEAKRMQIDDKHLDGLIYYKIKPANINMTLLTVKGVENIAKLNIAKKGYYVISQKSINGNIITIIIINIIINIIIIIIIIITIIIIIIRYSI